MSTCESVTEMERPKGNSLDSQAEQQTPGEFDRQGVRGLLFGPPQGTILTPPERLVRSSPNEQPPYESPRRVWQRACCYAS
jgi:hypothetical protein